MLVTRLTHGVVKEIEQHEKDTYEQDKYKDETNCAKYTQLSLATAVI